MNILFYLLDTVIVLTLIWFLTRCFQNSTIQKAFRPALCLKLLAGVGMGLLYQYYYNGGDTFSYFNEAVKLNRSLISNPDDYLKLLFFNEGSAVDRMQYAGQPRALFMVKLLSLINLVTYNNYWFSSIFFSLFSFAGLWTLANRLSMIYARRKAAILLSLLFFPSVVFWSSGIIKESIAVGAIGFLIASFLGFLFHQKKISVQDIIVNGLMLFLLWNTKYYYAGALLLLIMAIMLTRILRDKFNFIARSPAWQLTTFGFLCLFCLSIISLSHPNFYFDRIMQVITDNYYAFAGKSGVQDIIHYHELRATAPSLLMNAPKALFSGLFRPFIGESTSLLKVVAGAENLVLFFLSITALLKIPKKMTFNNRLLLISVLVYCAAMSIFLALSAPNFGTLIRYKAGFIPFLLLVITLHNPLIERVNALVKYRWRVYL